jgi:hypothetical protein
MPELLHEYWESDSGGSEFGPVRETNDALRLKVMPGARLVFSLRASSWFEAMQAYQERLDYGDYVPAEGVSDHFYSDEEAAEQEAYLKRRAVPGADYSNSTMI